MKFTVYNSYEDTQVYVANIKIYVHACNKDRNPFLYLVWIPIYCSYLMATAMAPLIYFVYEIYNIYHLNSGLKIYKPKLQCTENYIGEEVSHLSKNCKTLLLRNTKYIVEEIRQLSKNRKSQVHCQLVLSESPAVRLTIGLCHKLNWCTFYCVPTYHQGEQGRNTWTKTKHTQQT